MSRNTIFILVIMFVGSLFAQDTLVGHYAGDADYNMYYFAGPDDQPAPDGWALYLCIDGDGDGVDGIGCYTLEPEDDDDFALNNSFYISRMNGAEATGAPGTWYNMWAMKIEEVMGSPDEPVVNPGDHYFYLLVNSNTIETATHYCVSEVLVATDIPGAIFQLGIETWTDNNWVPLDNDLYPSPVKLENLVLNNNVLLTWSAPTATRPDCFNVYIQQDGVDSLLTTTQEYSYTVEEFPPGDHLLGVSAMYGANESVIRHTAAHVVTTPYSAPQAVSASYDFDIVSLHWDHVEPAMQEEHSYYRVFEQIDDSIYSTLIYTRDSTLVICNPSDGDHLYTVQAVFADSATTYLSDVVSVSVQSENPPPYELTAELQGQDVLMDWSHPGDRPVSVDLWEHGHSVPTWRGDGSVVMATEFQSPGACQILSLRFTGQRLYMWEDGYTFNAEIYEFVDDQPSSQSTASIVSCLPEQGIISVDVRDLDIQIDGAFLVAFHAEASSAGIGVGGSSDEYPCWELRDGVWHRILPRSYYISAIVRYQNGDVAELTRDVSSYKIYRSLEPEPFQLLNVLLDLNFTDIQPPQGVYQYYVTATYDNGHESEPSNAVDVSIYGVGDETVPELVNALERNLPNPFNPTTTIRFSIAQDTPVQLDVYNVRGQRVRTLLNERREAGKYSVVWDGLDMQNQPVSSGVYLYRLTTPQHTEVRKALLLK